MFIARLSGLAEHWESLERFVTESGPAFPAGAGRRPRRPRPSRARPLDEEIESLTYRTERAEIIRIASAAAFAGRLPDCRQALRRVARPELAAGAGTPAMQANILLALEAYQTGQWDEAWQIAETAAGSALARLSAAAPSGADRAGVGGGVSR